MTGLVALCVCVCVERACVSCDVVCVRVVVVSVSPLH